MKGISSLGRVNILITSAMLTIHKPTDTTVSFTVSTRSPLQTFRTRALHCAVHAIRIALIAQILLILWIKWEANFASEGTDTIPTWLQQTPSGQWALHLASTTVVAYLLPASAFGLWVLLRRGYTGQSSVNRSMQSLFAVLMPA